MARYKKGDSRKALRNVISRCWGVKGDKCFITGKSNDLTVHHCGLSFNEIFIMAHEDLGISIKKNKYDYSMEEYIALKYTVLGYHYMYAEPITLTRDIHDELHNRYGETPTKDDLMALKKEYESRINNNVEEIA